MTHRNAVAICNILAKHHEIAKKYANRFSREKQVEEVAMSIAGYMSEEIEAFNYERFMLAVTGSGVNPKEI